MLRRFKSLGRQPAKSQHMKIHDNAAVRLLEVIYRRADAETSLYGATPAVFRRRWDFLLDSLGVDRTSLRLTPGGLRGGAAVHRYRTGMQIPQLLWEMRLRHQGTLESYLQETGAIGVLRDLPADVRTRVSVFRAMFPFLRFGSPGAL